MKRGQLITMLEMQAAMNAKVNPAWLTAGYPYLRAAAIEGAEAIEHVGWKWWKAQTPDMDQVRMELVDIWHFALSDGLVLSSGDAEEVADEVMAGIDFEAQVLEFDGRTYYLADRDLLSLLDLTVGLAMARRFSVEVFGEILKLCGMTWGDLFKLYVGKNVLNTFRQDNGYKQGTYQKLWAGREDNEHLTEILLTLNNNNPYIVDAIYMSLASRYDQVLAAA